MEKTERMNQLKKEALILKEKICHQETKLVWGEGNLDSILAIVGEAPAFEEDRVERPFVGRVGRYLDKELEMAGIVRKNAYVTNVVKCRPVRTKGTRLINRSPSKDEVSEWANILLRELEIVRPRIILCMGNTAASILIQKSFEVCKHRGEWHTGPYGEEIMATYHPAYVARFGGMNGGIVQQKFRRDLKTVAAELNRLN